MQQAWGGARGICTGNTFSTDMDAIDGVKAQFEDHWSKAKNKNK